jgi:hypothetical protein
MKDFEILLNSCKIKQSKIQSKGGSYASTDVMAHVSESAYENIEFMLSGGSDNLCKKGGNIFHTNDDTELPNIGLLTPRLGLPQQSTDSLPALSVPNYVSLSQPLSLSTGNVGNLMTFPDYFNTFSTSPLSS